MFNWEDLNLPEYESVEDVKDRLDRIHQREMEAKGVTKVDGSGFRPKSSQSREVSVMAALGLTPKEISQVINVDEKMLTLYYKKELSVSKSVANAVVARKALEMAASGRFPDMTKFWLKSQAKWKETNGVEITGKDGGPVEINTARDKLAQVMGLDSQTD